MVSVVVPTYSRAGMVSKTISSILNQTYHDLEVIVVSDGYCDNTRKAVDEFGDKRLRYYEIRHSGRPAVPRNFGINKASGQYLAFCDDDDIWMSEKLGLQMEKIAKDSKIGLVYARCLAKGSVRDIIIPYQDGKEGFIFKELFLSYNFIPNSTVLIKREVIREVGNFEEDIRLKAAEDFDLWLRIAQRYKIGFVDKVLAVHKESEDSISKGTLKRLLRELLVSWKFCRKEEQFGSKLFVKKLLSMCRRCILGLIQRSNLAKFSKRNA